MATSSVAQMARSQQAVRSVEARAPLRVTDRVMLGFVAYSTVAALELPLELRQRLAVVSLNLLAGAVIFMFVKVAGERPWSSLVGVRDWFPAALILLAYRESGLFFAPDPSHHLDQVFVRWDHLLFQNPWVPAILSALAPWVQYYLEVAYLLCYPLVPLGLGVLVLAKPKEKPRPQTVDFFWTTVLLAALFCYVVYPFFPLTPPRLLFQDMPGPAVPPFLRQANFWILRGYGVDACIFPSGHVAAVTATALAVRHQLPRLGVVWILAAASVVAATVFLRYHYLADAVAGAIVGCAAFCISSRIITRRAAPAGDPRLT